MYTTDITCSIIYDKGLSPTVIGTSTNLFYLISVNYNLQKFMNNLFLTNAVLSLAVAGNKNALYNKLKDITTCTKSVLRYIYDFINRIQMRQIISLFNLLEWDRKIIITSKQILTHKLLLIVRQNAHLFI